MASNTNILTGIHALKFAKEHWEDHIRQHGKDTNGGRLFTKYLQKIDWILMDFKTSPLFPQLVRDGLREEINADVFALPAIHEKIQLLPPKGREMVEAMIDALLKGEEIILEQQ